MKDRYTIANSRRKYHRPVCAFLFSVAASFMSACSSSTWVPVASVEYPTTSVATSESVYVWPSEERDIVGPGSLVIISSLDQNLNGTYRVDIDGRLKLPHEKSLSTQELDTHSLREQIQETYRNYFKSPQDLHVKVVRTDVLIDVQGLVMKPGQYSVAEATSLDEIIAKAGGLQDRSGTEKVRFINIKGPSSSGIIALADYHSGRNSITPHWHGGERLFFQTSASAVSDGSVPNSQVVRVIGQVRNPAEFTAKPDSTFFSYLLQAGGPTDRADLARITLIRSNGAQTRVRTFNSQNFDDIPPIEPGDTILVNADIASPVEKSSRVVASIASVLTSLSILAIATL